MPDTVEQELKFKISAEIDDSLNRFNKSLISITENTNKMGVSVANNFLNMGKQIENSTKSLNLGATFKGYFDSIAKSSASAFGEVKSHLGLIENALGKLPALTKEKIEIKVNISQTQAELSKVNNQIKETKILLKELADYKPSGGRATKALIALDESSLLKSSLQKDKVTWQEYYNEVNSKQKGLLSEVYTRTGELSNSVINQIAVNAKRASSLIKEVVEAQIMSLQRTQGMTGKFSPDTKNILVNKSIIDSAKREYSELNTYVMGLQKSLTEAIKAEQVARSAYDKQYTGEAKEQSRILAENAAINLKKITQEHQNAVDAMNKLQQKIGVGNIAQKSNIAGVQKSYAQGGLKYAIGFTAEELQAEGDRLKSQLKLLYNEMIVIGKRSSKGAISRGKEILPEFEDLKGKFDSLKNMISQKIVELRSLTSKGMINATPDIIALQKLEGKFTEYAASIRNQSAGLGKMTRSQLEQGAKGFFTKFWEGFRDLRWQMAAAAYMFNMFVKGIINNFDEALNKISEFNKEVFGLAATIGIAMGKNAPKFSQTFEYSAEVLTKLQTAAAGTYLKMEDLQMIVRTFAMHGMFPKSDQDIKSLVTIASGVKILTEGMANEGVQMRQEIDALLSGRARVTDTLARTFKRAGIDIKKEMQSWQSEGISTMQGLARAMQSMADMNTKIIDQYAAQKNLLKSNYEYIQRTYLSGLHTAVGEFLVDVNKSLGVPGEYIGETGRQIGELLVVWNSALAVLGKLALEFVSTLLDGISNLAITLVGKGGLVGSLEVVIKAANIFYYAMASVLHTTVLLVGLFKGLFYILGACAEVITGDFVDGLELLKKGWEEVASASILYYRSMDKASDKFFENWENASGLAEKISKEVNFNKNKMSGMVNIIDVSEAQFALKQIEANLDKTLEKYKPKTEKLDKVISDTWEDYNTKMVTVNATLGKLQIEQKALFEAMQRDSKSALGNVTSDMELLVAKYKRAIGESGIGGVKIEDRISKSESSPGFVRRAIPSDVMGAGLQLENERNQREIEKGIEKQTDAVTKGTNDIRAIQEAAYNKDYLSYMNYLERLNEDTINAYDKLIMETDHLYQEIRLMADPHGIIAANLGVLDIAIYEKRMRKEVELNKKKFDDIEDMIRKSAGFELSEFEKIQKEKENMIREVNKSLIYREEEKIRLIEILEINSLARISKAKLEQSKTIANEQINTANLAADLLSKSYGQQGQQLGQLLKLQTDYNKNIMDAAEKIRAFGDKWGYSSDEFKKYITTVQEGLKLQEMLMEYQKERVMNPFFADLEEMSKGWVDTLSDGIADIIMDFDKLGETADKIFKNITKQILTAFIKRQLIEPLMDQMGGLGIFKVGDKDIKNQTAKYMQQMTQMQTSNQSYLNDVIAGKFGPTALGSAANPMYVIPVSGGLGGGESGIPGVSNLFGGGTGDTSNANIMGNTAWQSKVFAGDFSKSFQKVMQEPWFNDVLSNSYAKGIDPALTLAIMKNESAFNVGATSPVGAGGLMQLMPGTLKGLGYNSGDLYNPQMNISAGTDYLSQLQYKYGFTGANIPAGYNAGPGAVQKYGGVPPYAETQKFSAKVQQDYEIFSQDMNKFNGGLNTGTDNLGGFSNGLDGSITGLTGWEKKLEDSFKRGPEIFDIPKTSDSTAGSLAGSLGSTTGVMNVTAQMVNVNGGGIPGAAGGGIPGAAGGGIPGAGAGASSGIGGMFSKLTDGLKSMVSGIFGIFKNLIGGIFDLIKSLISGIGSVLNSLTNSLSSMGSGGGGGLGGIGSWLGGLFGGGGVGFAKGGILNEPVFGVGLNTGTNYSFGEDEPELFIPKSKLDSSKQSRNVPISYNVHMGGIHINSIDTQTGADFLLKNGDVIQTMMIKQLKNNKQIRRAIPNSY